MTQLQGNPAPPWILVNSSGPLKQKYKCTCKYKVILASMAWCMRLLHDVLHLTLISNWVCVIILQLFNQYVILGWLSAVVFLTLEPAGPFGFNIPFVCSHPFSTCLSVLFVAGLLHAGTWQTCFIFLYGHYILKEILKKVLDSEERVDILKTTTAARKQQCSLKTVLVLWKRKKR